MAVHKFIARGGGQVQAAAPTLALSASAVWRCGAHASPLGAKNRKKGRKRT